MNAKPMNDAVRHLRDWCMNQRESMQKGVEMMRAGILRTHQQSSGGNVEDTTNATMADYEQKIAELDELLAKIKADHA